MTALELVWKAPYDESCAMHRLFVELAKGYDVEKYCVENSLELYHNKEKRHFNYHTMHKWSIDNTEQFWETFFKFSGLISSTNYTKVLADYNDISEIPKWFLGCKLNYAENLLKNNDDSVAVTSFGEGITESHTTFRELNKNVRDIARAFRACGLKQGDVVGSLLPNVTFAVECMLATASIGAIWTCASPETQTKGIVMRMNQTQPKLLLSYDKVVYNGKTFSQVDKLHNLSQEMSSLQHVIVTTDVNDTVSDISSIEKGIAFKDFMARYLNEKDQFSFEQVPFDHPLFIMYSSGTTGIPKGLVHSVGGTLIQHLKDHIVHESITLKDVFFYYTITAWMMWNWLVTSLATGCRIVLYNGSPFHPTSASLWDAIEKYKVTILGAGAAYYQILENQKYDPKNRNDLSALRLILSTGSVLPGHTYDYMLNYIKNPIQICSIAAATDAISCFGGVNPMVNVYREQVQNINLGMGVQAWVDNNTPVFDSPGELVVTKPFPSMPVYLWNDSQKEKYTSTYFSRFPGVWAQGDFCQIVSETKGIIMLGRSDATLNPFGVRFGSAEIYAVVEEMPEVEDSLCVGQMHEENERVILFVKLKCDISFTPELDKQIRNQIRNTLSVRHIPKIILPIADIPYTLTGKKIEMAVKRILCRQPFIIQRESLRNPQALDLFFDFIHDGTL